MKKRIGRTGKDGATDTKAYQVTLDEEAANKARRIGESNLSLGVRIAVKAYPEKKERR